MIKVIKVWDHSSTWSDHLTDIQTDEYKEILLSGQYEYGYPHWLGSSVFDEIMITARNKNIKVTLLTGSIAPYYHDQFITKYPWINVISWLNFYISRQYFGLRSVLGHETLNKPYHTTGSKLFSLLNGKKRWHRCETMDMLAESNLLNDAHYSWLSTASKMFGNPKSYEFKFWQEHLCDLDNYDPVQCATQIPPQFYDSSINIVSESVVDNDIFFVTEKTSKPLVLKKPFLVIGSQHFHANLKTLGYVLYTELFDYSFDDNNDPTVRIREVVKNLKTLQQLDRGVLHNKLDSIREKIEHNAAVAKMYATEKQYYPAEVLRIGSALLGDTYELAQLYHIL